MKYVSCVLTPEGQSFDSGGALIREVGMEPQTIEHIEILSDDSVLVRYTVGGTVEALGDCDDDVAAKVIDYQVFRDDGTTVLQVNFRPSDLLRELLELHHAHGVLLDYPLEFVDQDAAKLRVVEVGPAGELRDIIAKTRDLVDVVVEEFGDYNPVQHRPFAELTDRQQEVLGAAMARGYYDVPRRVTHEDIAADLDCSASAVGQHLQRIEGRVLSAVVPESVVDESPDVARSPGQ